MAYATHSDVEERGNLIVITTYCPKCGKQVARETRAPLGKFQRTSKNVSCICGERFTVTISG